MLLWFLEEEFFFLLFLNICVFGKSLMADAGAKRPSESKRREKEWYYTSDRCQGCVWLVPLDFGGRRHAAIRRCRSSRRHIEKGKMWGKNFIFHIFPDPHFRIATAIHKDLFFQPTTDLNSLNARSPVTIFRETKIQIQFARPAWLWWAFNDFQRVEAMIMMMMMSSVVRELLACKGIRSPRNSTPFVCFVQNFLFQFFQPPKCLTNFVWLGQGRHLPIDTFYSFTVKWFTP